MSVPFAGLLVFSAALGACPGPSRTHEQLLGTLWVQTSVEYRMGAEQAYRLAQEMVEVALKDPSWTAALEQETRYAHLPPAVILDLDETVLDNSPFQSQLIKEGTTFNESSWERWARAAQARAVPGALDFVKYLQSKGVEAFYITNRHHAFEADTRRNLQRLGFPVKATPDSVLTKNEKPEWGTDKSSRRRVIARDYRILLLVGDDLNDFLSGAHILPDQRLKLAATYQSYWGTKWILIPNPVYGSWERALYGYASGLPQAEKLNKKYEKLEGIE